MKKYFLSFIVMFVCALSVNAASAPALSMSGATATVTVAEALSTAQTNLKSTYTNWNTVNTKINRYQTEVSKAGSQYDGTVFTKDEVFTYLNEADKLLVQAQEILDASAAAIAANPSADEKANIANAETLIKQAQALIDKADTTGTANYNAAKAKIDADKALAEKQAKNGELYTDLMGQAGALTDSLNKVLDYIKTECPDVADTYTGAAIAAEIEALKAKIAADSTALTLTDAAEYDAIIAQIATVKTEINTLKEDATAAQKLRDDNAAIYDDLMAKANDLSKALTDAQTYIKKNDKDVASTYSGASIATDIQAIKDLIDADNKALTLTDDVNKQYILDRIAAVTTSIETLKTDADAAEKDYLNNAAYKTIMGSLTPTSTGWKSLEKYSTKIYNQIVMNCKDVYTEYLVQVKGSWVKESISKEISDLKDTIEVAKAAYQCVERKAEFLAAVKAIKDELDQLLADVKVVQGKVDVINADYADIKEAYDTMAVQWQEAYDIINAKYNDNQISQYEKDHFWNSLAELNALDYQYVNDSLKSKYAAALASKVPMAAAHKTACLNAIEDLCKKIEKIRYDAFNDLATGINAENESRFVEFRKKATSVDSVFVDAIAQVNGHYAQFHGAISSDANQQLFAIHSQIQGIISDAAAKLDELKAANAAQAAAEQNVTNYFDAAPFTAKLDGIDTNITTSILADLESKAIAQNNDTIATMKPMVDALTAKADAADAEIAAMKYVDAASYSTADIRTYITSIADALAKYENTDSPCIQEDKDSLNDLIDYEFKDIDALLLAANEANADSANAKVQTALDKEAAHLAAARKALAACEWISAAQRAEFVAAYDVIADELAIIDSVEVTPANCETLINKIGDCNAVAPSKGVKGATMADVEAMTGTRHDAIVAQEAAVVAAEQQAALDSVLTVAAGATDALNEAATTIRSYAHVGANYETQIAAIETKISDIKAQANAAYPSIITEKANDFLALIGTAADDATANTVYGDIAKLAAEAAEAEDTQVKLEKSAEYKALLATQITDVKTTWNVAYAKASAADNTKEVTRLNGVYDEVAETGANISSASFVYDAESYAADSAKLAALTLKINDFQTWREENTVIGDADGDGTLDVNDVMAMINYILDDTSALGNADNADADGDGVIDINDVQIAINRILNN